MNYKTLLLVKLNELKNYRLYTTYKFFESIKRDQKLKPFRFLVNKSMFPQLNSNSIMKLRHLSIISLANKSRTISYETLSENLGIKNIRELEDLIIEAFYVDVIKGKLDQLNNQLEIEFAIGRDVTDQQIDEILSVLDNWFFCCFFLNV